MRRAPEILLLLTLAAAVLTASGRRLKTRLDTKEVAAAANPAANARALEGDSARQAVSLFGYDKPLSATRESLFVRSQLTADTVTAVVLEIKYRTPQGEALSRRRVEVPCLIPPMETRRLQFRSWDDTRTFYYYRTPPARTPAASPYTVQVLPLKINLAGR